MRARSCCMARRSTCSQPSVTSPRSRACTAKWAGPRSPPAMRQRRQTLLLPRRANEPGGRQRQGDHGLALLGLAAVEAAEERPGARRRVRCCGARVERTRQYRHRPPDGPGRHQPYQSAQSVNPRRADWTASWQTPACCRRQRFCRSSTRTSAIGSRFGWSCLPGACKRPGLQLEFVKRQLARRLCSRCRNSASATQLV